ncbi:MAG: carboxypeptidase M32 [Rhodobacteraceae bacterium]|nr:carboxypeptidase M32 [Paracoccaceae bacterium]
MSYELLLDHIKKTTALAQVSGLLSWDQETQMPPKGGTQRAEHMGAIEGVLHARRADPRIPEWISRIDQDGLDIAAKTNIAEAQKAFGTALKVPADLAEALAKHAAKAQGLWAKARAAQSFADFAPALREMVNLKRQEAAARQTGNSSLYDTLMDDYEPGMKTSEISGLLADLREGLVDLRARIADSGKVMPTLKGDFPADRQMALARALPEIFGYDWEAGRMDIAVHPFCSGNGGDVRLTTRVDASNPFDCIYSTIHETGHGVYEQNIPGADSLAPAHSYASMGVHESQSRMMENQIGRSRAFAEYLFPMFKAHFGDIGVETTDDFHRAVNNVRSSYIRTESDEVHYNLHIMMRFDLERALIEGDLEVDDLESAWNERFKADFGVTVDAPANGVLQDVHWSVGLFGYFPTYSLGNLYAGELFAKMQGDIKGLDDMISRGKLSEPLEWLHRNVHDHGRMKPPAQLIEDATGHKAGASALLEYLNAKFGDIYGV